MGTWGIGIRGIPGVGTGDGMSGGTEGPTEVSGFGCGKEGCSGTRGVVGIVTGFISGGGEGWGSIFTLAGSTGGCSGFFSKGGTGDAEFFKGGSAESSLGETTGLSFCLGDPPDASRRDEWI